MIFFSTDQEEEFEGHIGDRRIKQFIHHNLGSIYKAQADGDELDYAWRLLGRTGKPPNKVHSFYGDTAKELVFNWLMDY